VHYTKVNTHSILFVIGIATYKVLVHVTKLALPLALFHIALYSMHEQQAISLLASWLFWCS
jgi:hypothetical protein